MTSEVATHEIRLDEAAKLEASLRRLDANPADALALRHCERELTVSHVLLCGSGEVECITAHRVRHLPRYGVTMGPMWLRPDCSVSDLREVSQRLTWQFALLGIPAAGAAGAILVHPQELSERELRGAVERATAKLWSGGGDDLICGGAPAEALQWMAAACGNPRLALRRSRHGSVHPSAVSAAVLLEHELGGLDGKRIAVQGLGRVGMDLVQQAAQRGARIVAVADVSGGAVAVAGIAVDALREWMDARHLLFGFDRAEPVTNAEVLECPCDALVLAAAKSQVTIATAKRLHTPVVLDAHAGATTAEAQQWLHEHGIRHIPDLLASAGDRIAAWMEWLGTDFAATEQARSAAIGERVLDAWNAVLRHSHLHHLAPADAALDVALTRLLAAR